MLSTSIVATAHNGGSPLFRSCDGALPTRAEIEANVVVLLAGRIAEFVAGKGASAGAGIVGDVAEGSALAHATVRLADVHACYGLGRTVRHRRDVLRAETVRRDH